MIRKTNNIPNEIYLENNRERFTHIMQYKPQISFFVKNLYFSTDAVL